MRLVDDPGSLRSRKTTETPSTRVPTRSGIDEYATGKMVPSLRVNASPVARTRRCSVPSLSSAQSSVSTRLPSIRWKCTFSCTLRPLSSSSVQPSIFEAALFM